MPGVMAVLLCDRTVTVCHRGYDPATRSDTWSAAVYTAASWYGGQAATSGNTGLVSADAYTVRIATAQPVQAAPGDVVVLGRVEGTITGSAQLTRAYAGRCFVVTRVQDNRRGARRTWHWKLEGK